MAKKKQQKSVKTFFLGLSALFGLAATAMIFLCAFKGVANIDLEFLGIPQGEVAFTGIQASIGLKEVTKITETVSHTNVILTTNFFSLMAYAIPLVAVIFMLLFSDKKIVTTICAGALIAAGIFAFLSLNTFPDAIVDEIYKEFYDYSLGVGSILCGIFSILSGFLALLKILATKK